MAWGKRPTAVLFRDEWFDHRDPFTWEPIGDKDEWTEWDFLLMVSYQTIEAYTDDNGVPRWKEEDDNVEVQAKRVIKKFKAEMDIISNTKDYKPTPGETFVPDFILRNGADRAQTYSEWVAKKIAEQSDTVE